MNLNKTIIVGRITKDPETRTMPSGAKVASFGMATNRFYKDNTGAKKDEVEFHNIVLFGKLADIAEQYVRKGGLLLVEGRLKTQSWEKDGVKRYKTEIIGESIQLGPRPGNTTASVQKEPENNGEASQEEMGMMDQGKNPDGSNQEIDVNDLGL